MEKLKKDYEDVMNSSDGCPDITEDVQVLQDAANEEKSIKEEMNALKETLENDGIEGLKKKLSAYSNHWKTIALHIAVTGSSGAGKSAFINAIRDVCAVDDGAAKVGVTETTTELKPYKHPRNPNFIVWDMPGVGTPKFPKDGYLECVKFDRYDFFMILSKSRFTENDLWLAKQIQERNKRFYFIRANIDTDINNDKRSYPKSHTAHGVMTEIRQDCLKNLVEADIEAPLVFLVDNHDRMKYEFGNLEKQLLKDSDNLKVEAIALSLSALTRDVLQKKKEVLEARIKKKAMEIACIFDDEYEQKLKFDEELEIYMEQFNLDEQTLSTNKEILSLSERNLIIFQTIFKTLSEMTACRLYIKLWYLSKHYRSNSFIRLLAQVLSIPSFWIEKIDAKFRKRSRAVFEFSSLALNQNLQEMYEMALNVYDLAAQKGFVKSVMKLESD